MCCYPNIDGHEVSMELDTGAAISVINESMYKTVLAQHPLLQSLMLYYTLTLENNLVFLQVTVHYSEQVVTLPLFVLQGSGPSLFGRNWVEQIRLNWPHQ